MKVCELFAGVGGFRLGLEKCSDEFNFIYGNQWEPSRKSQDAFKCYINHFGKNKFHTNIDIAKINKDEIPDHDLLVGGFPCQDYSVARTGAEGIKGVKGVLWWEIADVLKKKKPRFVLLENVDRLLKSPRFQRGRDFGVMLACLNDLEYSIEWRVINAAEYGFPQRRRRVFLFAFRNDTKYANIIKNSKFEEYLHKKGFFKDKFPILPKNKVKDSRIKSTVLKYDSIADISDEFKFRFENSGFMSKGKIYTEHTVPDYSGKFLHLKNILEKDVDEKYYIDTDENRLEKYRVAKSAKQIDRVSKEGHCYVFREGNIAFPDYLDRPARTMLTSEATVNRSTHIIEDIKTKRLRVLTPIETERLNGFNDDWTNTGMSERFRYFCMGNALVVGLIEKMGETILDIYKKE